MEYFNNLERDQFCLRKILDWRENWLFFLFSLKNKIRIEHNFLISCGEILLEEGIKIRYNNELTKFYIFSYEY